ncbi:hypothetical protein [Methylomonas koyamae]|uniref:Uncharacterized protein n=2 Tax=Methylomonas TaxID=416 RepID=A0A177P6H9_9GAMM|nr:hypothetical protein [Methylomonas koyamae]OAI25937.1 hypothetical protein A1355_01460 [Methylomonas koyamae]
MTSTIHALANRFPFNYTSFNGQRAVQTDNSPAATQDTVSISDAGRQAWTADSVTQAGTRFQQLMAEKTAGQNFLRNAALANPHSSDSEQFAYDLAHDQLFDGQGGGGLISLGATPNDPLHYSSGELVTEESKAYFTEQASQYQQAASKLYDSAKAAGISAGEIVNRLYDLQAQQPSRFRAMMMWPSAG